MRSGPLILGALLLLSTPSGAAQHVLTNLRLVDPSAREVKPASLLVGDGLILGIGSPAGDEFDAGLPRRSGEDRWAVPAFFDASIVAQGQVSPGHRDRLSAVQTGHLLRAAGISTALDLDGTARPEAPSDPWAARLLVAGPVLVASGGAGAELPGAIGLEDEVGARSVVRELIHAERAPARLTVIFDRGRQRRGLVPEILAAVLEEAGTVPVAVQVGTWRDAYDALVSGARWLAQIPPGAVPAPVLEEVRRVRPAWTPAVAVASDFMALMAEEPLRASPSLARALPEDMRSDYGEVRVPRGRLNEARLQNEDRLAALAALHGAGAELVAGSQSGGLGTAHGWSLLRELGWWRRAGIDAWSVLAGATLSGPMLLGRPAGFVEGARADFTVYPRSPIDSLGIVHGPDLVFVAGEPTSPAALAARVEHQLIENVPESPLPGGNQWSLVLILLGGFGVLLFLRHLVRRAAARAELP